MNLRVLHIAETLRGGLNTYLEEIVALQRCDNAFGEIAVLGPQSDLNQSDVNPSARFGFVRSGRNLGSIIRFCVAIIRALLEFQPTVIHLHSSFAGFAGRILLIPWTVFGSVQIFYTAHGWSFLAVKRRWQQRLLARVEKALAMVCFAVIAVSKAEKSLGVRCGIPKNKIHVVYNPRKWVGGESLTLTPTDSLRLLFVGRLDRAKGFDILLSALAHANRDDWVLNVVGDAVHDEMPAVPPGIRGKVTFTGWLKGDDLYEFYKASNCVLIPSRWEAFGLVAIEAMQFGRAVIASRVGGLQEIVEENITGKLVSPTAEAWSATIDSIRIDDLRQYGLAARASVKDRFDPGHSHRVLKGIYLKSVER